MTKKPKRQYRIRNWSDYNRALIARRSLTLWIDSQSTDTWLDHNRPQRRVRRRTYTEAAILCALLLREVYHLPLRSTQGLIASVFRLLRVSLPVMHYSTLSRRARSLHLCLAQPQKIRHLVIDYTGLKLYGEGSGKSEYLGLINAVHGENSILRWMLQLSN